MKSLFIFMLSFGLFLSLSLLSSNKSFAEEQKGEMKQQNKEFRIQALEHKKMMLQKQAAFREGQEAKKKECMGMTDKAKQQACHEEVKKTHEQHKQEMMAEREKFHAEMGMRQKENTDNKIKEIDDEINKLKESK